MERVFASAEYLDTGGDAILECSDRVDAPIAERILPDGGVHLIFNLGDRQRGERGADLPCVAVGPSCRPTRIEMTGALEQVCVRLRLGTAAAVLGVPAGAVKDLGVALDDLWGAAARDTLERLHAAPRGAARRAVIGELLRARLRRADPAPGAVQAAVRRIVASAGQVQVRELAAALGLGERRLQQLFQHEVGLSPKETCRLARFRGLLARGRRLRSWGEAAVAAGFYDQAHLVHELRAFTGLTPGELARRGDFAFFQDADRPGD